MASEVKKLCEEYINGKSERNVPLELAKDISVSKVELVELVEALGSWLTSKEVDHRAQGTKLLSEVLGLSTDHTFSSSEVQYLSVFYCDRLKDNAIITPYVLHGLYALAYHQLLSDYDVVSIIRTIFNEIYVQSLPHASRRTVFLLLCRFIVTHSQGVSQISSEFLLGYIQNIDGEKDPRNLVIIFNTVPLITTQLNLNVLVEDFFEVLSCYFPINFTPSPTDPDAISKDELVSGLQSALTSTPLFAEYLLPLLLDKLSSDLHGSKMHSLETITAGAPVFGSMGMSPFIQSIWDAIRKEVLQPVADNIEAASLNCLKTVVKNISDSQSILDDLIANILKDCTPYINGHDPSLLVSSCRLLMAAAAASSIVYTNITEAVFPLLLQQMNKDPQTSWKISLLQVIIDFIEVYKLIQDTNGATPNNLFQSLYPLLLSYLSNDTPPLLAIVALATLSKILHVHGLSNDEVGMGCGDLLRLAYNTNNNNIREGCCKCLSALGQSYPSVAMEFVLSSLFTRLSQNGHTATDSINVTIQLVTSVSTHCDVIITSLPVLTDLLKTQVTDNNGPFAVTVSNSIKIIMQTAKYNQSLIEFASNNIIPVMLTTFITSSLNGTDDSILGCSDVLSNISDIIRHHTLSLDNIKSQQFAQHVIETFTSQAILSPDQPRVFEPLKSSSPWQQTELLCFLTAVLSTIKVYSDRSVLSQLFVLLVQFSLDSDHTHSVEHAVKGCGCIANKSEDLELIENESERVWSVISDSVTSDSNRKRNALSLLLWICKGLLLRSDELALIYSLKLLTVFSDDQLGEAVVIGYGYPLLGDPLDCLNNECRANIRLFHKQWYFSKMVPNLLALYGSQVSLRSKTIQVLSLLMQSIPKQVLLAELPKLLPLLLESINPVSSVPFPVLLSSLSAILSLIVDAPVIISDHVTSIIPHLLQIAKSNPLMKVRILSLKCMNVLTVLPPHLLYPHQKLVIHELSCCLDDNKRLVRKEAVNSRNAWYMLGIDQ